MRARRYCQEFFSMEVDEDIDSEKLDKKSEETSTVVGFESDNCSNNGSATSEDDLNVLQRAAQDTFLDCEHSCGGFMTFLGSVNDRVVLSYFDRLKQTFEKGRCFAANSNSSQRFLQAARMLYNYLPLSTRNRLEMQARVNANRRIIDVDSLDQVGNAAVVSEFTPRDRQLLNLLDSAMARNGTEMKCSLCRDSQAEPCSRLEDYALHLDFCHEKLTLFVCIDCGLCLESKEKLHNHSGKCASGEKSSNSQRPFSYCLILLVCKCCGLTIPLHMQSADASWNRLVEFHNLHNCSHLAPVFVYSTQELPADLTLTAKWVPSSLRKVWEECLICEDEASSDTNSSKDFSVAKEGKKHRQCPRCDASFCGESDFRHHLLCHQPNAWHFGDFIKDVAVEKKRDAVSPSLGDALVGDEVDDVVGKRMVTCSVVQSNEKLLLGEYDEKIFICQGCFTISRCSFATDPLDVVKCGCNEDMLISLRDGDSPHQSQLVCPESNCTDFCCSARGLISHLASSHGIIANDSKYRGSLSTVTRSINSFIGLTGDGQLPFKQSGTNDLSQDGTVEPCGPREESSAVESPLAVESLDGNELAGNGRKRRNSQADGEDADALKRPALAESAEDVPDSCPDNSAENSGSTLSESRLPDSACTPIEDLTEDGDVLQSSFTQETAEASVVSPPPTTNMPLSPSASIPSMNTSRPVSAALMYIENVYGNTEEDGENSRDGVTTGGSVSQQSVADTSEVTAMDQLSLNEVAKDEDAMNQSTVASDRAESMHNEVVDISVSVDVGLLSTPEPTATKRTEVATMNDVQRNDALSPGAEASVDAETVLDASAGELSPEVAAEVADLSTEAVTGSPVLVVAKEIGEKGDTTLLSKDDPREKEMVSSHPAGTNELSTMGGWQESDVLPVESVEKEAAERSKEPSQSESAEGNEVAASCRDDNEIVVTESSSNAVQPDTAPTVQDDDVMIIDEGQGDDDDILILETTQTPRSACSTSSRLNASGNSSNRVAGDVFLVDPTSAVSSRSREKRYRCGWCPETFFTKSGWEQHQRRLHSQDISNEERLCDEDFGVPRRGLSYLCVSCCAAFETRDRYLYHQQKHAERRMTVVACSLCSGLQTSMNDLRRHMQMHAQQKIEYRCIYCRPNLAFREESQLYLHLKNVHSVELYYFCKSCFVGSTNGLAVYTHIKEGQCRKANKKDSITTAQLGLTVASQVMFQPSCVAAQFTALQRDPNGFLTPTGCSHRSFLRFGDKFTPCGDSAKCCGLTNWERWRRERPLSELPPVVEMPIDSRDCLHELVDQDLQRTIAGTRPATIAEALARSVGTPTLTPLFGRTAVWQPRSSTSSSLGSGSRSGANVPSPPVSSVLPARRRLVIRTPVTDGDLGKRNISLLENTSSAVATPTLTVTTTSGTTPALGNTPISEATPTSGVMPTSGATPTLTATPTLGATPASSRAPEVSAMAGRLSVPFPATPRSAVVREAQAPPTQRAPSVQAPAPREDGPIQAATHSGASPIVPPSMASRIQSPASVFPKTAQTKASSSTQAQAEWPTAPPASEDGIRLPRKSPVVPAAKKTSLSETTEKTASNQNTRPVWPASPVVFVAKKAGSPKTSISSQSETAEKTVTVQADAPASSSQVVEDSSTRRLVISPALKSAPVLPKAPTQDQADIAAGPSSSQPDQRTSSRQQRVVTASGSKSKLPSCVVCLEPMHQSFLIALPPKGMERQPCFDALLKHSDAKEQRECRARLNTLPAAYICLGHVNPDAVLIGQNALNFSFDPNVDNGIDGLYFDYFEEIKDIILSPNRYSDAFVAYVKNASLPKASFATAVQMLKSLRAENKCKHCQKFCFGSLSSKRDVSFHKLHLSSESRLSICRDCGQTSTDEKDILQHVRDEHGATLPKFSLHCPVAGCKVTQQFDKISDFRRHVAYFHVKDISTQVMKERVERHDKMHGHPDSRCCYMCCISGSFSDATSKIPLSHEHVHALRRIASCRLCFAAIGCGPETVEDNLAQHCVSNHADYFPLVEGDRRCLICDTTVADLPYHVDQFHKLITYQTRRGNPLSNVEFGMEAGAEFCAAIGLPAAPGTRTDEL